ncbi:uncharacterized protein METZ01_LOCUS456306, partial [marine metagenome]
MMQYKTQVNNFSQQLLKTTSNAMMYS